MKVYQHGPELELEEGRRWRESPGYGQWIRSLDLPIHTGFYIEDLRTIETGWWEERGCNSAFVQLYGLEDIQDVRVMEIPPGKSTKPWRFALDDVFYVLSGKGLATVWSDEHSARKTFEWQERSLFMIPHQLHCQLSNASGEKPARLLSHNYLPLALQAVEEPDFFFNNPNLPGRTDLLEAFYSEAKEEISKEETEEWRRTRWVGNFFPDMGVWDKMVPYRHRGAGGWSVSVSFPNSSRGAAMSIFPELRYKKGHRHVSGVFIIIPAGVGYSIIHEPGLTKEPVICHWQEGSCFAPQFYHQHFNLGKTPARYLKFGPGGVRRYAERHMPRVQTEYPDEAAWIREYFEKELAKRDLTSLMPGGVYKDKDFNWEYAEDSNAD
ncbi:MAG: hypothetical protein Q8O55_12740 [Dehalococcoidales bacterium]|nr:hypothetical protein [Dehalococcoidales bacterium]MDZ4245751.1 cupin domain-containing protein [Dehalococcoidia bacterium]